ncbi:hypothetical protein [Methanoregula sp.]|uniref:hypothetical protein n=1 Tax=Methanoregula sp. TaxID=2052170 RepID=UPI002B9FDBB6|nr:hypothetical protein [Methanoregula sp.]HVP96510.1 hypothetical protein [Methanoregula sp.]
MLSDEYDDPIEYEDACCYPEDCEGNDIESEDKDWEVEEYYETEEDEYEDECLKKEQKLLKCDDDTNKRYIRIHNCSILSETPHEIAELIIKAEERKAKSGLIIGFICILLGAGLTVSGATGAINWNFNIGGFNSSLSNAAPGVVLMIIGFLVIIVTNYKVVVKK